MDISSLFTNETDPPASHPATPTNKATKDPTAPALTPVQRIRAFRDGALEFPDINKAADEPAIDPLNDQVDNDDCDDISDNENASDDTINDDNDTIIDDDDTTPHHSTEQSRHAQWIEKRRKPLAIGGILIAAGAIIPAILPNDPAPPARTTATHTTSRSTPPPPPAQGAGDTAVQPTAVEVGRDDCAIGSTPPLDAFNTTPGEHRTAWICQRPYGAPGTTMTITLPTATTITEISAIPGFDGKAPDGTDTWPKYQLVAAVSWYLDYGTPTQQRFTTKRETQAVTFDPPVISKTIRLVINETVDVPPAQATSPSNTATTPGLFSGFDDWSRQLGGTTPNSPTPGAGPAQSNSAFAMGSIQIIGHPSR